MKTTAAVLALILSAPALAADSRFDELDKEAAQAPEVPGDSVDQFKAARSQMLSETQESAQRQLDDFEKMSESLQAQYDAFLKGQAEQLSRMREAALKQWTEYHESTTKVWVDYNDKADAFSQVDFEKGKVEVEVLVPLEDVVGKGKAATVKDLDAEQKAKLKALAEKKLAEQTREMLAEKDGGRPVLEGQVKTKEGAPVTEKNAEAFVKKTLAPKMVIEDKPVVAQDGKPRMKVKVAVDLVPDHLKVRAKAQQERVIRAAAKYDLDPALVFAVIHTESEFNPRARSHAPAFGLMQLMPPSGAREAYKYLYKEDKLVTPEYLYDPENNVLLGATYLHMLQTRHFGKIKSPEHRRTLSIAAYNCGPGCVRKNVLKDRDVDALSDAELLAVVKRTVPKETQHYVPRVRERMALYRKL